MLNLLRGLTTVTAQPAQNLTPEAKLILATLEATSNGCLLGELFDACKTGGFELRYPQLEALLLRLRSRDLVRWEWETNTVAKLSYRRYFKT